jgi:2-oxoglutarate dehydrogenase complex dehydrogenase (E1) component-like enzyme
MTPEEKQISFYNRYFIFRKNRNINAKQLKSSFLSYAGLQEEQDRAASAAGGEEDVADIAALEKIAKASRPTDVASKPAIAAHILAQREAEKQMEAITGDTGKKAPATLKIKPKPKPKLKTTATTVKAAAAAAAEAVEEEVSSAPIAQIEKKIQKRTKKVKMVAEEETAAAGAGAGPAAKRQTKKKTDL